MIAPSLHTRVYDDILSPSADQTVNVLPDELTSSSQHNLFSIFIVIMLIWYVLKGAGKWFAS
jgi:hypothetical protein